MFGGSNCRQRIELVVHAGECPLHATHRLALVQHIKRVRLALRGEVAYRCAKAAHLAPAASVQHAHQAFFQAVDDDAARAMRSASGHGAHQMVAAGLMP